MPLSRKVAPYAAHHGQDEGAPGNIMPVTNAIESLNASVRKAVRNKGHFPSDQAATKLIWLALRHITENWKRPPIAWQAAKAQLAIQFGERFVFGD
jgi:putative transposase